VDRVADQLEAACRTWSAGGDRKALRRPLHRLLADLDDE
jgi:hypothetical protein